MWLTPWRCHPAASVFPGKVPPRVLSFFGDPEPQATSSALRALRDHLRLKEMLVQSGSHTCYTGQQSQLLRGLRQEDHKIKTCTELASYQPGHLRRPCLKMNTFIAGQCGTHLSPSHREAGGSLCVEDQTHL